MRSLWTPRPDMRSSTRLGHYLQWLEEHQGLQFQDYDELWSWSVDDLDAFWSSIAAHFEVDFASPPTAVLGSRAMPGAQWFPGSTLNYAERALRRRGEAPAVFERSQTRDPSQLSWDGLRDQVARCRQGLLRLGVRRGDRVVGLLPNTSEALISFLAVASIGAIWASCPPEFGARSVIDRFAQLDPVVLIAVTGYRYGSKSIDRNGAATRDSGRSCRHFAPSWASPTATRPSRTRRRGRTSWLSPVRWSSTRCPSTTRSTCFSPPARPVGRRRSFMGMAGSCSSTSMPGPAPRSRGGRQVFLVQHHRLDDVEPARLWPRRRVGHRALRR